ncbi:MAG: hypothetical protein KDB27_24085 [Planctomycetales bacterium]|nr:hypothetical protein [Planctomycetales bacterium]
MTFCRLVIAGLGLSVALMTGVGAAERASSSKLTKSPADGSKLVELFQAVDDKQVEVKFVPKNTENATVIVKNLTDKPLSIKMPEAFAGVPVLAQPGNRGGGGGNRGGGGGGGLGGGGNQGMGGGMGMGGMGMMGGGMFNVGPEKVGKLKVKTVCLEHGKLDPNPRVPYEMKPIEEFTKKPELIEICKMLGRGDLDQTTAQAAAWNLSDGLSWVELANKVKVKHLNGSVEMYFSPKHIRGAMQAVQVAVNVTSEKPSDYISPGEELDKAARLEDSTVAR